jgi:predicted nucleic acid-binding protein
VTPVLVDTSVWRRYLAGKTTRQETSTLKVLLDEDGALAMHKAVLGELILGGLAAREEELLRRLPIAPELESAEVLAFIKARNLARRGVGWVDAHLLASALVLSGALWTLDRRLAEAADELGIGFAPSGAAPSA